MAKKKETLDPPTIEVAPECQHTRCSEMRQDPDTRAFLVRNVCPKCGWASEWQSQRDAILTPIDFPLVQRF
jgi:hypothetical protein